MRTKIQQRRQRTPAMASPPPETPEETATRSNGLETAPQPSLPVSPPAELVQAVVRLVQRVDQLEQVVGGMHQRQNTETQALLLKARSAALERATEIVPDEKDIALQAAHIKEIANYFFPWLCLGAVGLGGPPPEEPPAQ